MAKGRRIDTLTDHTTGLSGELRFEKGSMAFIAVVGDEEHEGKDGEEVRAWLRKRLAAGVVAEWTPVIELVYEAPPVKWRYKDKSQWERVVVGDDPFEEATSARYDREATADVFVRAARYYVGKVPQGSWRQIPWEMYDRTGHARYTPAELVQRSEVFSAWGERAWSEGEPVAPYRPPDKDRAYKDHNHEVRVWLPHTEAMWAALVAVAGVIKRARQQIYEMAKSDERLEQLRQVGAGMVPRLLAAQSSASAPADEGVDVPAATPRRRGRQS